MTVNLVWITPDTDKMIGYMARVSNPSATVDDPSERLIKYLLEHKHFSPFEMASACVEITTTRDIARQILRHRSFHFQEFSQRYSEVEAEPVFREARLQDKTNRQNSIQVEDNFFHIAWERRQAAAYDEAIRHYKWALRNGIAKEVARAVLPEGLTPTKMYMAGTIRDWLFYLSVRMGNGTQKEHVEVADAIYLELKGVCPVIFQAAEQAGIIVPPESD